jgi:hypothetical protein
MLTTELAGGPVHLSALPVEGVAGEIVLVHDLGFLGRRAATTRGILLIAFFLLALGASAVTFLRRGLPGETGSPTCAERSLAKRATIFNPW